MDRRPRVGTRHFAGVRSILFFLVMPEISNTEMIEERSSSARREGLAYSENPIVPGGGLN
jgi:hypothetical protein